MAKDGKDKQGKEIKRLRKKINEMADLIEVQGEVMHGMSVMLCDLHSRWAGKAEQGNSGPPVMPGRQGIEGPGRPVIGEPVETPDISAFQNWPGDDFWQVGWDPAEGRPVRVASVTPNRDPEAGNEYTFWFTEEMCERLGIPDIQYHLVEHPDGGGRLQIEEGPPTQLAPEHREILDNLRDRGDSNAE